MFRMNVFVSLANICHCSSFYYQSLFENDNCIHVKINWRMDIQED